MQSAPLCLRYWHKTDISKNGDGRRIRLLSAKFRDKRKKVSRSSRRESAIKEVPLSPDFNPFDINGVLAEPGGRASAVRPAAHRGGE